MRKHFFITMIPTFLETFFQKNPVNIPINFQISLMNAFSYLTYNPMIKLASNVRLFPNICKLAKTFLVKSPSLFCCNFSCEDLKIICHCSGSCRLHLCTILSAVILCITCQDILLICDVRLDE